MRQWRFRKTTTVSQSTQSAGRNGFQKNGHRSNETDFRIRTYGRQKRLVVISRGGREQRFRGATTVRTWASESKTMDTYPVNLLAARPCRPDGCDDRCRRVLSCTVHGCCGGHRRDRRAAHDGGGTVYTPGRTADVVFIARRPNDSCACADVRMRRRPRRQIVGREWAVGGGGGWSTVSRDSKPHSRRTKDRFSSYAIQTSIQVE